MPEYSLEVLGLRVSFKTDVPPERVKRAKAFLEERYKVLETRGSKLSKEKLLIYLCLGLADDYLCLKDQQKVLEKRINELLDKLD